MNVKREVLEAVERIRPYALETPLEYSRYLSKVGKCKVYLKLENIQRTGSFKIRSAANFLLSLPPGEFAKGVITASTGNHAAAFAEMMEVLGHNGTIYLPKNSSKAKAEMLHSYDVQLKFVGEDAAVTEATARQDAAKQGHVFVPPYNHPKIIGGQGTIGVEIMRQLDGIDAVIAPVGGGGLMSGIAGYLKAVDKKIRCIGSQPLHSPVMYESVKAGRIVEMKSKPTLADGTAGGIEPGSITFDICRDNVDEYSLVTEENIAESIRLVLKHHFMLIEGAAALSVASFLKYGHQFKNKTVVLIISGRKLTLEKLKKILL